MRLLLISAVLVLSLPAFAQEEYGVFTMSVDAPAPKAKPAAQPSAPLPQDPRVDDREITMRKGRDLFRHKVCVDGQYVAVYDYGEQRPARKLEGKRQTLCKEFYGPNTPVARQGFINEAKKEFNFYNVFGAAVTETEPVPDPSVQRFPLNKMKTASAAGFNEETGVIYKLILADKAKIRRLYSYAYDQAALAMDKLLKERDTDDLPVRLSLYEDYTPGFSKAIAVFTFKDGKKYVFDINDLNKSGLVYDIKPDFAVRYHGAPL